MISRPDSDFRCAATGFRRGAVKVGPDVTAAHDPAHKIPELAFGFAAFAALQGFRAIVVLGRGCGRFGGAKRPAYVG